MITDPVETLEKLVRVFPGSPKLHLNPDYNGALVVVDFGNPVERPFCTDEGWQELREAIYQASSALGSRAVDKGGSPFTRVDEAQGVIFGGVVFPLRGRR